MYVVVSYYFCVVSPKKYIHFVCIFFLQNLRRRCCLRRQAGHCFLWWGCKIYKRCKLFFWHFISCIFNWFKESFKFRKHISGSMKNSGWTWKAFYGIRHLIGFFLDLSLLFFLLLLFISAPLRNISPGTFAPMPFDASIVYEYIFCSYIFAKNTKKNFTYITYRTYFYYCSLVVCIREHEHYQLLVIQILVIVSSHGECVFVLRKNAKYIHINSTNSM